VVLGLAMVTLESSIVSPPLVPALPGGTLENILSGARGLDHGVGHRWLPLDYIAALQLLR